MSKELEAFVIVKNTLIKYPDDSAIYEVQNKSLGIIEKGLKALEIIKEKGIILQFIKETYTVEQYNAGVFGTLVKPLTQEEFDLLKEVLK